MDQVVLQVESVSKKFCKDLKRSLWYGVKDLTREMLLRSDGRGELRAYEFWALKDVSFELKRGETLGLIGLNGAGKSTLLKLINGLIRPDAGRISVRGRVGALIELGTGFNPILTGLENIYVNGAILGLGREEIDRKLRDIIDFAEIGDFIDAPVQSYSSGMKVRLGFAVAAHLNPDILLIDEILSVGDASYRRRCLERLDQYRRGGGTVVFVSHNSRAVEEISDRVLLLGQGQALALGEPVKVVRTYEELAVKRNRAVSRSDGKERSLEEEDDIIFTAVECYDFRESRQSEFRFGDPIEIRLHYQSVREIGAPYFVVALRKSGYESSYLAWLSMHWDGVDVAVIPKQGVVRCLLRNPNLAPGNYCIEVGVQGHTTAAFGKKWHTALKPFCEFTILPDSSLKMRFPGITSNELVSMPPLILDCTWDINGKIIERPLEISQST